MSDALVLPVSFPRFDERRYLELNPTVGAAIKSGKVKSALDHYLKFGIDDNKSASIRRESLQLACLPERFLVSESGFCLVLGWLADEGCDVSRIKLIGGDFNVELPAAGIFRHARKDVEVHLKGGAFDYGFVAFGRSPSRSLLKQSVLFNVASLTGTFQTKITPEIVSDKRLMNILLEIISTCEAHAGKQVVLQSFLGGMAGRALTDLFRSHVETSTAAPYVQRFRPRQVSSSFVTVLFGSTEPIKLQPMLFKSAGIDVGEWIYVCNSPEDAEEILSCARLMSELYDVMITVIVLGDNAGFGAANNVAISHAASDRIFIINPDVYPMPAYVAQLREVLGAEDLGNTLWGGLLFYDDHNLMHSGMYVDRDAIVRRNSLNRIDAAVAAPHGQLLRVEHFDKGVPFVEAQWHHAKDVPAITGAVMAFDKSGFEKAEGFSTRYIYGHYEDADLSLRWRRDVGPVRIHPKIRLVHLEGQGARARGEQYRGAAIANRHFFTAEHGEQLERLSSAEPAMAGQAFR